MQLGVSELWPLRKGWFEAMLHHVLAWCLFSNMTLEKLYSGKMVKRLRACRGPKFSQSLHQGTHSCLQPQL